MREIENPGDLNICSPFRNHAEDLLCQLRWGRDLELGHTPGFRSFLPGWKKNLLGRQIPGSIFCCYIDMLVHLPCDNPLNQDDKADSHTYLQNAGDRQVGRHQRKIAVGKLLLAGRWDEKQD